VHLAGTLGVSGEVEPIACADGELTTSIMWSLTRLIDTTCGFPGPISLACNKLLSPPQLCAVDTQLTEAAGNITDGAPLGNSYSASTECSWTVNKPEQPYISLNFTRLSTETLYDMVTVEVCHRIATDPSRVTPLAASPNTYMLISACNGFHWC
jgi:hypothetical protein